MSDILSDYNSSLEFKSFFSLLENLIKQYIDNENIKEKDCLCVSRYLELSIVSENSLPKDTIPSRIYPMRKFIQRNLEGKLKLNKEAIFYLTKTYIVEGTHQYIDKEEIRNSKMLEDFSSGKFPAVFNPYFRWKLGQIDCREITMEEFFNIKEEISKLQDFYDDKYPNAHDIHDNFIVDDPWQFYRGYGEDKYMASHIDYIDDQLTDIQMIIS